MIARWYLRKSGDRYVAAILMEAWKYSPSFAVLRKMSEYGALVANDSSFANKKSAPPWLDSRQDRIALPTWYTFLKNAPYIERSFFSMTGLTSFEKDISSWKNAATTPGALAPSLSRNNPLTNWSKLSLVTSWGSTFLQALQSFVACCLILGKHGMKIFSATSLRSFEGVSRASLFRILLM